MLEGYLLYLLCHGKAVKGSEFDDFKRPLAPLGLRQIQKRLLEFKRKALIRPDCILCSTAKRATETAAVMTGLFKGTPCFYRDSLYLAPAFRIFDILKETDPLFRRIMIIGHQRGLEQMVALLSEKPRQIKLNYGKCICVRLKIRDWRFVKAGIGKIMTE